jgi:hypothetical protein
VTRDVAPVRLIVAFSRGPPAARVRDVALPPDVIIRRCSPDRHERGIKDGRHRVNPA